MMKKIKNALNKPITWWGYLKFCCAYLIGAVVISCGFVVWHTYIRTGRSKEEVKEKNLHDLYKKLHEKGEEETE